MDVLCKSRNRYSSKAQCKECKKLLSLGSDKPRLQTVSGLKGHLASFHKELHGMYLKRATNDDAERAAKKTKLEEEVTKHALRNFVQTSLPAMAENRMLWPEDQFQLLAMTLTARLQL